MPDIIDAPPLFRTTPLPAEADAAAAACGAAAAGADPATLLWCERSDRAVCAVVLAPEQPLLVSAQMVHVGVLALGDALGAVLPALLVVSHLPPGELRLNDARLGSLRLLAPPATALGDVPDWLVLATEIGVTRFPDDSAEVRDLSITTLEDEGCMGIEAGALIGAFARYLLAWINRWQADGFAPVRSNWLTRAPAIGAAVTLRLPGRTQAGTFAGLGDDGAVLIGTGDDEIAIAAIELVER